MRLSSSTQNQPQHQQAHLNGQSDLAMCNPTVQQCAAIWWWQCGCCHFSWQPAASAAATYPAVLSSTPSPATAQLAALCCSLPWQMTNLQSKLHQLESPAVIMHQRILMLARYSGSESKCKKLHKLNYSLKNNQIAKFDRNRLLCKLKNRPGLILQKGKHQVWNEEQTKKAQTPKTSYKIWICA